jgi:ABC-type multidrug transport system fused ATPase/permease subunit
MIWLTNFAESHSKLHNFNLIYFQEPFYNNETQTVMNNGCRDFYLGIYGGFGLMQAFSILVLSVTLSITTLAGSRKLHRALLDRVLKSPMEFFDTTPLGRIVNRYCNKNYKHSQ